MMTTTPTGRVIRTSRGPELVLTRTFRAPIDDVWASVTESERTARWFGPWKGDAAPGRKIQYSMAFEQQPEDGPVWSEMTIEACEAPRLLELSAVDDYGSWYLVLELTERAGETELRFTQRLDDKTDVSGVGPGWEYYLDNLVASREDRPKPDFNDYYPSMKDYYAAQAEAARG